MSAVALERTTLPRLQEYYRHFRADPDLYMDMALYREYVYAPEKVEAYYRRISSAGDRADFLVLLDGRPVGEVALKRIDRAAGRCELSIHLQNDSVKNRGVGTLAERLALAQAFGPLGLETVCADAVLKNARSRHVLEKVGFRPTCADERFVHYEISAGDFARG